MRVEQIWTLRRARRKVGNGLGGSSRCTRLNAQRGAGALYQPGARAVRGAGRTQGRSAGDRRCERMHGWDKFNDKLCERRGFRISSWRLNTHPHQSRAAGFHAGRNHSTGGVPTVRFGGITIPFRLGTVCRPNINGAIRRLSRWLIGENLYGGVSSALARTAEAPRRYQRPVSIVCSQN